MHPGSIDPIFASDNAHLRAGDDDRQRIADRLKTAVDEGRLSLDEYDQRLTAAYAARTFGELATLAVDLPAPVPQSRSEVVPVIDVSAAPTRYGHRWAPWRPWLTASVITTVIWFLAGLDGEWSGFWPVWVIVPWGIVLAARTGGWATWQHRKHR